MYLSIAKETWANKKSEHKAVQLDPETIGNIAVIKHAAFGDMVLTRPMLISLREAFPNAKITLSVIEHYMRGIPEDLIDDLHITKGKGTPKNEVLSSLKTLPQQDILFDITASSRSMLLSLFTKAKLKIGYIHKGLHKLAYDIAIPRAHYRFEAETFAEQTNVLGIDFVWPMNFGLNKPDAIINKPYIVYFTTASSKKKSWPAENYTKLIKNSINKHSDYTHILLSGISDWEIEIANTIKNNVGEQLQLVYGGDNTDSIIANASLLVSNDTGIRNLAIAHYTPTVGIFPPNTSIAYGYRPYFGQHTIIHPINNRVATIESVANAIDMHIANKANNTSAHTAPAIYEERIAS